MYKEIQVAVEFMCILLPKSIIPKNDITIFAETLTHLLTEHCRKSRWIPHVPLSGSAYRAITRFDRHIDKLIVDAASTADISLCILQNYLPRNFVIWIDPCSVSYRLRDVDNIVSLYEAPLIEQSSIKTVPGGNCSIPSSSRLSVVDCFGTRTQRSDKETRISPVIFDKRGNIILKKYSYKKQIRIEDPKSGQLIVL